MKGLRDELDGPELQVQLLIGLLHIGVSQLTQDQWDLLSDQWETMNHDEQEQLKTSLNERIGRD